MKGEDRGDGERGTERRRAKYVKGERERESERERETERDRERPERDRERQRESMATHTKALKPTFIPADYFIRQIYVYHNTVVNFYFSHGYLL